MINHVLFSPTSTVGFFLFKDRSSTRKQIGDSCDEMNRQREKKIKKLCYLKKLDAI